MKSVTKYLTIKKSRKIIFKSISFSSSDTSYGKLNIIRLGNDDFKKFSKSFSPQEIEKYLDPYGFLNEYKKEQTDEYLISLNTHIGNDVGKSKEISSSNCEIEKYSLKQTEIEKMKINIPKEYGMKPRGPEPTRYGDWERNGKCVDF